MPAAIQIARRYLLATRSSRYLAWMTALSIAGISIGIASMINVLSVINGFEKELRDRFLAANAHILAFQYPSGIDDPEAWIKLISEDFPTELTGVSPFVHSETMATKDGLMHNILVRGIQPRMRAKVQDLGPWIKPQSALKELEQSFDHPDNYDGPRPMIIGSGLLSILQSKVGETIKLVAPESASLGEFRDFKVVGVYDSGLKHYDNKIGIMALTDAQRFFRMKQRVHGVEIGLKNPTDSKSIAEKMSRKYSLTIKEWLSFNKQMFEAMEMERAVIALIVALVAFVASFNILTTLFITVTQKQRAISVLKALGATNKQIQAIFITQGLLIGLVGGVLGMIIAFGISKFLETFEVVNLPDLYLLARLPIIYDLSVYLTVAISGCIICVIAGIYPAWVASRINIVDGLRGNNG
jgi:lipoprotein-releasing system permease protein